MILGEIQRATHILLRGNTMYTELGTTAQAESARIIQVHKIQTNKELSYISYNVIHRAYLSIKKFILISTGC